MRLGGAGRGPRRSAWHGRGNLAIRERTIASRAGRLVASPVRLGACRGRLPPLDPGLRLRTRSLRLSIARFIAPVLWADTEGLPWCTRRDLAEKGEKGRKKQESGWKVWKGVCNVRVEIEPLGATFEAPFRGLDELPPAWLGLPHLPQPLLLPPSGGGWVRRGTR